MEKVDTDLVLRAVRENKEFRLKFSVVADEVVDKIYSYHQNPNCTCKGAIVTWINSNQSKTLELINSFKTLFENLKQTPAPVTQPSPTVSPVVTAQPATLPAQPLQVLKIGTIETIERTPQAYANLFSRIKKEVWVFRGLNVVPTIQDGKEVWSIFFY